MSSTSLKSDDVTLIAILSTVTVDIILSLLHSLSIKMKTEPVPLHSNQDILPDLVT
jgi:hypothetical protein